MDTITQIALGAGVGEAVLGRQVGRRAMLWGGVCGLFPDLDVLVPLGDAVKNFTYHRGPSHSLFVLAALTPVFVYAIRRLHAQTAQFRTRWYALVYLAFVTHVLLDCLTVYGTQILWPLRTPPVMWSTIFIIDPAYSIPLFAGVLTALILSRKSRRGRALNAAGLILSTLYLAWSIGAKQYVDIAAHESLKNQNIAYERLLSVPAPFNTLLWRVLVMDGQGYHEGFYSLLDEDRHIRFDYHASDPDLLDGLDRHWPVERLKWFTHGFYSVERLGSDIVMRDLRMGLEPHYAFSFKVGQTGNPQAVPSQSKRVYGERGWGKLYWVWQRIWTDDPEIIGTAKSGATAA